MAGFPWMGYAGSLDLLFLANRLLDGFIEQELSLFGLDEHVVFRSTWPLQSNAQRQIFGPNFPDFDFLHCLYLPMSYWNYVRESAALRSRALPQQPLGLRAILEP